MNINLLFFIFPLLVFSSCSKDLIDEEFSNTPLGNFDAVWNEYDKNYGAFEAKNINWDSIRLLYRSTLSDQSSDKELYNAITRMLAQLNDGHVQLIAPGYKRFFSKKTNTIYPDSKNYENSTEIASLFATIKVSYLLSHKDSGSFFYGIVRNSSINNKIGYIYISSFNRDIYPVPFIDAALNSFSDADGIIIDLRFNGGGATETFLGLLHRFTDTRRLYLKSRIRNGPGHNDFTQVFDHFTWPEDKPFAGKKIVVLVNRFSGSSSEHFMMGMKALPYATIVGDTTCGALSTVIQKIMPNGWEFRMCPQVLLDTLGNYLHDSRGRYLDGVGLAPDIYVVNYLRDLNKSRDLMLERAVKVLNSN